MKLTEIKTMQEIAKEYGIAYQTLQTRIRLESFGLIEGVDYRRLGQRQPTLFSPSGINKITKGIERKEILNKC